VSLAKLSPRRIRLPRGRSGPKQKGKSATQSRNRLRKGNLPWGKRLGQRTPREPRNTNGVFDNGFYPAKSTKLQGSGEKQWGRKSWQEPTNRTLPASLTYVVTHQIRRREKQDSIKPSTSPLIYYPRIEEKTKEGSSLLIEEKGASTGAQSPFRRDQVPRESASSPTRSIEEILKRSTT